MATNPVFVATAKVWQAQVSAANTNRDGTGTLVDIVTAGAAGSRIDRIEAQATVTTAAGTIRFFIYDGVNNRLWREVATVAVTPSGTVAATSIAAIVDSSGNNLPLLLLPVGFKLRACINNAEAWNVIAEGGDF